VPDNEILTQFQEFLDAKAASEKEQADNEDFDVEIWDEKGRGVRTKRSHAKPFLQSLGIDIDPPDNDGSDGDDADKGDKGKTGKKSTPASGPQSSVARKYFAPKPPAK
jgi:hypothetical protein